MRKGFFPRLAATGLKNNRQTYLPYFLTCTGTVMMFYNMCALTYHASTIQNSNLSSVMGLGMGVTAIFAVIFLFYTNSFVIKRRKKEFGLYNILGLEKKHIGITMFFESLYVYLGSTALGIGLGILFNKLVTLLLYRILNFDPNFQFEISPRAIVYSIVLLRESLLQIFCSICFRCSWPALCSCSRAAVPVKKSRRPIGSLPFSAC